MSRSSLCTIAVMVLGLALPACRSGQGPSAGRPGTPATPAQVQQLVGQSRILRHRGHEKRVSLKRTDLARLTGGCDAAVEVRQAALEGGTLRLSVAHVGRPSIPGRGRTRERPCEPAPDSTLTVSGVASGDALAGALDALLPTPENYLKSNGTPFDRDPGAAPAVAAADGMGTTGEERNLARQVSTWPVPLLTVEADVPTGKRVGGRESEVDFVAVVGTDGRLHAPRVTTPLSDEHVKQLMRALALWRYQPARGANGELPARVNGKAVLRLY